MQTSTRFLPASILLVTAGISTAMEPTMTNLGAWRSTGLSQMETAAAQQRSTLRRAQAPMVVPLGDAEPATITTGIPLFTCALNMVKMAVGPLSATVRQSMPVACLHRPAVGIGPLSSLRMRARAL